MADLLNENNQASAELKDTSMQNESADNSIIEQKSEKQKAEEQQTIDESIEQQEAMKTAAIDQNLQNIDNKVDINASYQQFTYELSLRNLDGFLKAIDELLKNINNALDDCSFKNKSKLSKAWKKTLYAAKKKLNEYKNQLEGKKNTLTNPNIYPDDINSLQIMWQNVEDVKRDIAKWQRGELSNTAAYTYNSPENAKSSNRAQESMLQFEQKLQQEVKNWAILNIFNRQQQTATNFYRRIANWQYTSADYAIFINNSNLLTPSFQRCWISTPIESWIVSPSTGLRTWRYVDYHNMDMWEAFKQWWVAWVIDKALSHCNNLTPWQRETRRSIWVLAWFWAWIYWLFKFFTDKKMWFWAKAWITAGAFLWSEILTWENPISLFSKFMTWWLSRDKLKNSFWNAVSWVRWSGIESAETVAPAMFSLMVFDQWTTIWNINQMTQNFKSDNKAWSNFYQQSINKLNEQWWIQCAEYFRATFSDRFDEQKRNAWLASFWVTDISNPLNSGNLIYELANNATMNEVILEKFKSENWLKETNDKNKKNELKQYINSLKSSNKVLNIAILTQHKNDWFDIDNEATYSERPEDEQNKKQLENKVDDLSIDVSKKEELKIAIKEFYNKRTIESKPTLNDFSLHVKDWILSLTSHDGETSKINLEKKELVWFWNNIRFTDFADLINVADISNSILHSQKWKIPVWYPPFKHKQGRMAICFNDAKTLSTDFDTRVLSTWWWAKIKKTPQVYNNLKDYAEYLSNNWIESNKVEVNPTLYPNVDSLSKSWIIFTNENEVKELEKWLESIKNTLKAYYSTPKWSPFKIRWELLDNKKLVFTTLDSKEKVVFNEDISDKFPTILANEETFLTFMNDENNWMYEKWI